MLFHDFSFTTEQDRYVQDNIDWTFPEIVMSPLSIIDVIDKHIPQVCINTCLVSSCHLHVAAAVTVTATRKLNYVVYLVAPWSERSPRTV